MSTEIEAHLESCRMLLRRAASGLRANSRLPLGTSRRKIPKLDAFVLTSVVSPALNVAIGTRRISADEGLAMFLSLLEPTTNAEAALRRWIMGLRFLARHLEPLVELGAVSLVQHRPDVDPRFWMFFAIADFDAAQRLPEWNDCREFLLLDLEDDEAEDFVGVPRASSSNARVH